MRLSNTRVALPAFLASAALVLVGYTALSQRTTVGNGLISRRAVTSANGRVNVRTRAGFGLFGGDEGW